MDGYIKPENVTLIKDEDVAKDPKFTRTAPGRLKVNQTYTIIGACKVEATKTMNEWKGILVATPQGKAFPVAVNTLVGIGFRREDPSNENERPIMVRVKKQAFDDVTEVLEHKTKTVTVIDMEKLSITNFDRKNVDKDFPVLRKNAI